jgi:Cys-rich four helix bundle protein (predicted Tat secretion target)
MNRRQLVPALALGVTAALSQSNAQTKKATGNAAALAKSAAACVSTCEACLAHCLEMLASSPAMAACAKNVNELIAVCTALEKLALQNAPSLAKQAAVALDVCKRCEAQCRKFANMPPCKACADACAACAAECAKFA